MIDISLVFWVGAIGMLVGTVAFAWAGRDATADTRRYYLTLIGITGIATVAYVLMALGVGSVSVGERIVFVPRYVDWILTTPLIVLFLGLLAGIDRQRFTVSIVLNTVVMVAGMVAALLPGTARFALFGLGAVSFVALVYYLYGPITASARAQPDGIERLYVRLRNLTAVLWSIYPLIWVLGPPGLNLLTATIGTTLVVYLDLVTKVGFGLIALDASATLHSEFGISLAGTEDEDRTAAASD